MKKIGLLGKKLGHSYSPEIHRLLGGYDYRLFECFEHELQSFFLERDFDGINVTIPYKKAVIPYCSELSDAAKRIGSVNTIVKNPDGSLFGDNTDYFGFIKLVSRSGAQLSGKKVLLLGNGGVAPTIRAALSDLGAGEVITVSRTGENNYVNIGRHADAEIIVNATPVGMFPNNSSAPIQLSMFTNCTCVFDLIYNPARTKLLLDAEKLGIKAYNGLYMLVAQAARAVEIFTGTPVSDEDIDRVYNIMSTKMTNIALIGMPGCGKSTVAKRIAARTGRRLIDIDDEITKRLPFSIPEYFSVYGESGFRDIESEVLAELSKQSGAVIACGGGVVMRPENYELLHQNSTVVFLRRDLGRLPTSGRPLSVANTPARLASIRMPLYNSWCDITVDNSGTIESAASEIIKKLEL